MPWIILNRRSIDLYSYNYLSYFIIPRSWRTPAGEISNKYVTRMITYAGNCQDTSGIDPLLAATGLFFCDIPNLFHEGAARLTISDALKIYLNTRMTPSLPQRGRRPKGCVPVTPI
jgi:hypothetical protein